jgi:hypothetical protein
MPPSFVGKVLGLAPSCVHAICDLGADLNNGHAPIDFDGDFHLLSSCSDLGFAKSEQEGRGAAPWQTAV